MSKWDRIYFTKTDFQDETSCSLAGGKAGLLLVKEQWRSTLVMSRRSGAVVNSLYRVTQHPYDVTPQQSLEQVV